MLSAGELLCEAFEFLELDVNKSYEPLAGGCCVAISAGNSEPEPAGWFIKSQKGPQPHRGRPVRRMWASWGQAPWLLPKQCLMNVCWTNDALSSISSEKVVKAQVMDVLCVRIGLLCSDQTFVHLAVYSVAVVGRAWSWEPREWCFLHPGPCCCAVLERSDFPWVVVMG